MKTPILILHGWMVGGERYQKIQKIFEKHGYDVYSPDMPGFGDVPLTKPIMILDDYVSWVTNYMRKHTLKKVTIIGHSFGGRVAAKFAVSHPRMIASLVLTGAPLIKRPLPLKKRFIALMAKAGKKITARLPKIVEKNIRKTIYYTLGEWDYYKAGQMKETFKAIISEDLVSVLPNISVPTLVVWGDMDTFVPLRDGKEITAKIKDSTLDVIHNATHKLPYESPKEFADSVLKFLES